MAIQLNYNQLYVFYLCVKHASFKEAAKELNISVPAVSMQIKKLETLLEFELFIRENAQMLPTQKALEILPAINEMFSKSEIIIEQISALTNKENNKITIGLHLVPAQEFIPVLSRYIKKYLPEKEVEFLLGNHSELLNKMKKGDIDIALLAGEHELKNIHFQKFFEVEIVYAVCSTNNIIDEQPITLKQLEMLPTLLSPEGSGFSMHIAEFYKENNISLENTNDKLGVIIAKSMLPKTEYGAFITRFSIEKELKNKELVALDLEVSPRPYDFYFACTEKKFEFKKIKEVFTLFENVEKFKMFRVDELNF